MIVRFAELDGSTESPEGGRVDKMQRCIAAGALTTICHCQTISRQQPFQPFCLPQPAHEIHTLDTHGMLSRVLQHKCNAAGTVHLTS